MAATAGVVGSATHAVAVTTPPHVMIVLMENTSYEVVGNPQMPFLNAQVAANGSVSTTDLAHPSLPNYLGLTSGSIWDSPADTTPQVKTYPGPQFTDQLANAGIAWKAYMEDMPVACDLTDTFGPANYDVNHNPFMYFDTVRTNPAQCNRVVPYPQLTTDLNAGTAPSFIWVTPNLINDMHNGTPAQGDAFLQGLVTQVRASSWWTLSSRIIITWDEGATTEQVLTLVIGSAHGTAANGGNEYGTLRGLDEAYGVGYLGAAASTGAFPNGTGGGDLLPLLTGPSTAWPTSTSSMALQHPSADKVAYLHDGSLLEGFYDGTKGVIEHISYPSTVPAVVQVQSIPGDEVTIYTLAGSSTTDIWIQAGNELVMGSVALEQIQHGTYDGTNFTWDTLTTIPGAISPGRQDPSLTWTGKWLIASWWDDTNFSNTDNVFVNWTTDKTGKTGWLATAIRLTATVPNTVQVSIRHSGKLGATIAVYGAHCQIWTRTLLDSKTDPSLANWSAESLVDPGYDDCEGNFGGPQIAIDESSGNIHVFKAVTTLNGPTWSGVTYWLGKPDAAPMGTGTVTWNPRLVIDSTGTNATDPPDMAGAVDSSGKVYVFWTTKASAGALKYVTLVSPFTSASSATTLATSGTQPRYPHVPAQAPLNRGYVPVVYQSGASGPFSIVLDTSVAIQNLIANPGFESGSASWSLVPQATIDTTPANAHGGSNSLKLIATGAWQGSSQLISVTPGQPYAFSGWGKSSSAGGDYTLISYDSNGNRVGSQVDVVFFNGSGSWTQVAEVYVPVTGTVRVGIYAQSSGAGTFWFDDLSLSPTSNLVTNPDFEMGSVGWYLVPQATIDTNAANAHSGSNSLKLIATGAWQGSSQLIPVTAGQPYAFSGWGKSSSAGGDYTLISYDANFNRVGSQVDVLSFSGSGVWIQVAEAYVPVTGTVQVGIYPQSSGAGTFWFDDLSLSPTSNLVTNPGFEMGSVGWYLVPQATIDTNPANAHGGSNSLKLIATGAWQGSSQMIPVTAGQPYAFSGWGKSSSAGGDYTLISYDANFNRVGSQVDVLSFSGSGVWIQVAEVYVPVTGTVRVGIYPQSSGAGTFWFDDLSLSPTSNLVTNPGFEMGSVGWSLVPQATIDTSPANAHSGSNSLKLIATGAWQGSSQFTSVTASQAYAFSAWGKSSTAGGDYTLISFDVNGVQVGSHLDVPFNGTGSWVQVAATYTPQAGTVRVGIYPQSSGAGTYWFDDVSLQ